VREGDLLEAPFCEGQGPKLSPRTVQYFHVTLNKALKQGVAETGLLAGGVADEGGVYSPEVVCTPARSKPKACTGRAHLLHAQEDSRPLTVAKVARLLTPGYPNASRKVRSAKSADRLLDLEDSLQNPCQKPPKYFLSSSNHTLAMVVGRRRP